MDTVHKVLSSLVDPGGSPRARPPPTGSISFVFAYVFAKKCTHRRLAPPQQVGAPPTGNPGSATDHDHDRGASPFKVFVLDHIVKTLSWICKDRGLFPMNYMISDKALAKS